MIRWIGLLWVVLGGLLGAGCAGPGPRLAPLMPRTVSTQPDGSATHGYDMTGDGRVDYGEVYDVHGRIAALLFDDNQDGSVDERVVLEGVPADERHHLVIILDSVPWSLVDEVWRQGRLRWFAPPSRHIAPFPVMTDPSLTEFVGRSPLLGVEAEYYTGQTLTDGFATYAADGNAPWHADMHYYLAPVAHAPAYLDPWPWFDHELRRIQDIWAVRDAAGRRCTTAYCVGTSALGAVFGRNGHIRCLTRMDRFCRWMVYASRGRVCISLLSDHGHALGMFHRRVLLADYLHGLGYRVVTHLERPGDVVVPEFGMVSCAVAHTREPERVARDLIGMEGVELSMWREADAIMVSSRQGTARIRRTPGGFIYSPIDADPLKLNAILADLSEKGLVASDGSVPDRAWFEATVDHVYPDVVYRLHRAFNGLFVHQPDVMVSLETGSIAGNSVMCRLVDLRGAHGNLHGSSSYGFALTMSGPLPPAVRMAELHHVLAEAGVAWEEPARR